MEHFLCNAIIMISFLSLFLILCSTLYYFQPLWGLMGAKQGNFSASDLCNTVGFGRGLESGSRMRETSCVEVVLVQKHVNNRPTNEDAETNHDEKQLSIPGSLLKRLHSASPAEIIIRFEMMDYFGEVAIP